jgi:hypothetical protein
MSDLFNGYHVWLGIPLNEQPPNHYRLLGIALFETDLDVIDHAADRQMAHVRTFQSGRHGALSQQLLNELAGARLCLLDSHRKHDYDQQLRATLASKPQGVPVARAVPVAQPVGAPPRPTAVPSHPSDDDDFEVEPDLAPLAMPIGDDDGLSPLDGAVVSAPTITIRRSRRLINRDAALERTMVYVLIGVVAIVVLMVVVGIVRKLVGNVDWKQWYTVPDVPATAPAEPGAGGRSPGTQQHPAPPAPMPGGADRS